MAYIISSGEASDGIILTNDTMNVLDGGIVSNTSVNSSGSMFVSSGGRADSSYVSGYAAFIIISSGGIADNTITDTDGCLDVYSGGVANNTSAKGWFRIFNGGVANNTVVLSGANGNYGYGTFISSGGTANSTTVNSSGRFTVFSGGTADNTTVNSGGSMFISSGGTADSTTVNDYGWLYVFLGGVANSTTVNHGDLKVSSGGTANSATINAGGWLFVDSGGTVDSTTVNSGGSMFISSGGTANNTIINSGCGPYVYSGGTANNTTINPGGYLYVSGTANSTTINSGGRLQVSSAGIANSVTVNSGGVLQVFFRGIANNITVSFGGRLQVSSAGTANSTTINSGGSLHVSSAGTANSITVNSGGVLQVFSGGSATDIVWTPCEGQITVQEGGYATYVSEYSGVYLGAGNQLLSNVAIMNDIPVGNSYEMNVMSGGTATGSIVNSGGVLQVFSGGSADGTTVDSLGSMDIFSGGTAGSTMVNSGGRLIISKGGTATEILENGGYVSVAADADATFVSNIFTELVLDKSSATVHSGTTANSTILNSGGKFYIFMGGTADSTTVNSGGSLIIYKGGTATEILENGGFVDVADGANVVFASNTISGLILSRASATVHSGTTANSTTVIFGGRVHVSSGGTANSTTVNSGGSVVVSNGGIANNIIVNSSGSLCVNAGGTATDILWAPFTGILDIRDGAIVTFADELSGVYYGLKDQLISHAMVMIDNCELNDKYEIYVMSGGTVNNTIINSEGRLKVFAGGTANNTTLKAYGWMYVANGGVAYDTMMDSGGEFHVLSGGTANNARVTIWGSMFVSGGTANSTTVNSGGSLFLYGGTVNYTTLNHAYISIKSGTVNITTLNDGTNLSINRDVTANSTTVNSDGRFTVSGSGIANSTTINSGGRLTVFNQGVANCTTVNSGGSVIVSNGGIANSITINSGGKISVGGTLTGRIVRFGGTISMLEGSIVDFDLTQTAPGSGARINDLAGITGAPTWTVTVNDDQADGIYSLAGGAAGFKGTITVVNKSQKELGTLTVGGTTVISDTDYVLSLSEDGMLSLKIGEVILPSPYTSVGVILSSKAASVESGEMFYDTLIGSGGDFRVNSGGLADTTIVSGGKLTVNGGAASNTMLDSGGEFYVANGGMVSDTIVNFGGLFMINGGGTANTTVISSGGNLQISTNGSASCTNISFGGSVIVSDGGTADDTAVFSGGYYIVSSGGTANGITVSSGGRLYVSSSGRLSGRMLFESGAVVSALDGAFFDFDLRQETPEGDALMNDLSLVQGTPFYTITVDGTQASGTYRLVEGVSFFTGVIAFVDNSGEQLGALLVGQKLETEYADYTLKVTNGCLTVTVDNAGSVPSDTDTVAPTDPDGLITIVDGQNVALLWNESTDDTGVKEYIVNYSLNGEIFTTRTTIPHYVLKDVDYGIWNWSVQAVDFAGNTSAVTVGDAFTVTSFKPYKVEYSADNFEHAIRFTVTTPTLNAFRMSGGTYQMRVMQEDSSEWLSGDSIVATELDATPQLIKSDADGNADIFFANPIGTWESGYVAQHVGSIGDWTGTNEYTTLFGKNKLADIIEGSTDANILLMTDDDNGDTLFVDDIYTASPGNIAEKQSRIAQIDEIRAGAGNDIVDMTSQQFEYIGDGLTIRGGEGNDTIWANKGDNWLLGDAGNDRIVGASGNDVIAGGIGNDRMHGGGGNDVFTFCDNWGIDNVEQLATGSVTLWFASGDSKNWNAETLTYTDGENSVKVSGVTADKVSLKFGDDGSAQFASLTNMGAFFDATSERIFEESGKGMLASL